MREIVLIIHSVRSCHNVGSLLRTADGLGVKKIYMSGFTPYPAVENDERLPHIAAKLSRQIAKTSLGAEESVDWQPTNDLKSLIADLMSEDFLVAALEQTKQALPLPEFKRNDNVALIVGNEVDGIDEQTLNLADLALEIPMLGRKESFNVATSAAMALFYLRFI